MKNKTLALFTILLIASTFFSCYKKKDTVAVIHVVDSSGANVYNAQVILYGPGSQVDVVLRDTVYTNASGEARFNFNNVYQSGQAGVAVLDIEVTKGSAFAKGIIKIEQEETSREKVVL
ncbi:MAG: hypothetical protein Crog4KO_10910 [Crocinitomicaceae bacterium]